MNKVVIHYATAVIAILTTVAGFVTAATGYLPTNYRETAVAVASVLAAAAVGIKAFDTALLGQNVDERQAKPTVHHVGPVVAAPAPKPVGPPAGATAAELPADGKTGNPPTSNYPAAPAA